MKKPSDQVREKFKSNHLALANWENHNNDFQTKMGLDVAEVISQNEYDALFIFFMAGVDSIINPDSFINTNFVPLGEAENKIILETADLKILTDGASR